MVILFLGSYTYMHMEPTFTPQPQQQPNGKKVLLIEDERFISELYVRALERAGYQTKVISDGEQGLREAQTDAYDLILLDIMIPTMTGFEILRRLRDPNISQPIRAKIIIATNLEQAEENKAELEKQADAYIVKADMTPHQLVDFLAQVKA